MAVPVTCPSCGKSYQVDDQLKGRVVRCPCGVSVKVEVSLPQATPLAPDESQSSTVKAPPPRQPSELDSTPVVPSAVPTPVPAQQAPPVQSADPAAVPAAIVADTPSAPLSIHAKPRERKKHTLTLAVSAGAVVVFCVLIGFTVWALQRNRDRDVAENSPAENDDGNASAVTDKTDGSSSDQKNGARLPEVPNTGKRKSNDALVREDKGQERVLSASNGNDQAKAADSLPPIATPDKAPDTGPSGAGAFAKQNILVYDALYTDQGRAILTPQGMDLLFFSAADGRQTGELSPKKRDIRQLAQTKNESLLAVGQIFAGVTLIQPPAAANGDRFVDLEGPGRDIRDLAFSPNGKFLAAVARSEKGAVMLWDVASRKLLWSRDGRRNVDAVAFSPDSKLLAYNVGRKVEVLDLASKEVVKTLQGHRAAVGALAFSPIDVNTLASGGQDVRVWDLARGQPRYVLADFEKQIQALAYSHDGMLLAAGTKDHVTQSPVELRLYHAQNGMQRHAFDGLKGSVMALNFSPDDEMLLSAGGTSLKPQLRQWDLDKCGDPQPPQKIFLTSLPPTDAVGLSIPIFQQAFAKPKHSIILKNDVVFDGTRQGNGFWAIPEVDRGTTKVVWTLRNAYKTLVGKVGNSGMTAQQSVVSFSIVGDGKTLWTSQTLSGNGKTESFRVNVAGVRRLDLVSRTESLARQCEAAWGDLVLEF